MPKQAVVFGARGGIGAAVRSALLDDGYTVVPVNSNSVDFSQPDSYKKASVILDWTPDVVINCVGHFDNTNQETHNKTFDINVGSNWAIIQHYINNPPTKPVKIVMVGSSSYRGGRKDYILYSASKSALYNVWQGACDYFSDGEMVAIGLINPVRTRTPMIDMNTTAFCYEPKDVADLILKMASSDENQLVDMKYPEET
jgi:NAD(P)-dependent dehydrogenase (short-subunit alcohol dehydrogenase family)